MVGLHVSMADEKSPSIYEVKDQRNPGKGGETYGLAKGEVEHVRAGINGLSYDLVRPASIVAETAGDGADIALCQADRLSIVKRLNSGEDVVVFVNEVGEFQEALAPLARGHFPPDTVERLAGCGDSNVDILLSSLGNGADHLFCGGINDLKGLLLHALDPFVINKPVPVQVRWYGGEIAR